MSRQTLMAQIGAEEQAFAEQSRLSEYAEAKKAFLDGRKPDFSPRS